VVPPGHKGSIEPVTAKRVADLEVDHLGFAYDNDNDNPVGLYIFCFIAFC
jgi:hypothetical protein